MTNFCYKNFQLILEQQKYHKNAANLTVTSRYVIIKTFGKLGVQHKNMCD